MMRLAYFRLICCLAMAQIFGVYAQDINCQSIKMLDLQTAMFRAFAQSSGLSAAELEVWMGCADKTQAGFYPNPQFSMQIGDANVLPGSSDDDGLAWGIAQLFELGGKRCARVLAAQAQEDALRWELEIVKRNLRSEVIKRFAAIAQAQELMLLAEKQLELANNMVNTVGVKVQAGKESPVHLNKSVAAMAAAELDFRRAQRNFDSAKLALALLWGDCSADFLTVDYPLHSLKPLRTVKDLCLILCNNIDLIKGDYEILAACRRLELEKTLSIPDLILSFQVEHNDHFRSAQCGVGFTIPIPIFDRNQGGIARAQYEVYQRSHLKEQMKLDLELQVLQIYQDMATAYDQALIYEQKILGISQQAYLDIQTGFNEGKFDYLDVLDSQRSLFENQVAYIQILGTYHSLKAELERLVGCEPCLCD